MAKKSIFKRWIINSLLTTIIVLILGAITYGFLMKNYYYNAAKQQLLSRANYTIDTLVNIVAQDTLNINAELKNMIEKFDDKDKIELQAINVTGDVALNSTGFDYYSEFHMPDYEMALSSPNSIGEFIGKSSNDEKIMALSVMIPYINSEYSAVRYVISLEKIDSQIGMLLLVYTGIAFVIVSFMLITGMYFIKSIISPIKQVGQVAKKIALGDFNTRITVMTEDEIGELCYSINNMADEISATNKMKDEFISSVSHELRTPLTAIKGWAETLNTDKIDQELYNKGIKVINAETSRLAIMVEELLDFSRIQSGRMVLNKEKIDILAEIEEAVIIYESRAKSENKTLIYDGPMMVSSIFGDKNRLKQVFINLIDNAIKYSDKEDTVVVTVVQKENIIEIVVRDTGCGISSKDIPYVKDKFYKANSTRKGSGIGLSMVDDIIKMHGGTVDISSKLGMGTIVVVKIPVMNANVK